MTNLRKHTRHTEGQRNIPWPVILIVVATVLPIVAAYVAYYSGMGVPDETVNNGILLEPPVKLSALTDKATDEVPAIDEPKWRLLIPVVTPCEQGCKENLYTTRQVHIRLGEKGTRVERIAVNLSGEQGKEFLNDIQAEHPLLQHFSVKREDWDAWLQNINAPDSLEQTPYYILVDQTGFAMMYYTVDHHGNELLKDIKRVLRFTPE
jgi:cytochrome oxidase Cu insertion factor (SCO1/SenC/PrrC family)